MGVKRHFDEQSVQELPFKQLKQLDGNYKMTSIPEDTFAYEASEQGALSGDMEDIEHEPDNGLETSAPFSCSSSEEETGNDGPFYLPLYPDFAELDLPRRAPICNEDAYSYLWSGSPRKVIPIGQNHQADVPEWNPNAIIKKESFCSFDTIEDDNELKVVGTSIITMPDPNIPLSDGGKIGSGRINCNCLDKYSIRCVRQHVKEAREKLRESLGEENFADLGLHDMGEELALKWTKEEEHLFHEIIYTNPVSLGKNFWKRLSVVFPSRTSMELISYYFNVFILRRRAVQNRSDFLDIDSDDDEWQGDGQHPNVQHDNDSVESYSDEELQVDPESGISYDTNDDDDNDDDGKGDGDVGIDGQDASEKGNQEQQVPTWPIEKFGPYSGVYDQVNNTAKFMSSSNINGHDAHAIDFLGHSYPIISGSGGGDNTIQDAGFKSEHTRFLGGKINGSNEYFGSGFSIDGCDAKGWGDAFSTSRLKNMDLSPTCSMIEEIFGPFSFENN